MSDEANKPSVGSRLFSALQYPLPHHALSRLVHWLTRRSAGALHRGAIRLFIRLLKVDMADAAEPDPAAYDSFNAFFTRALKPGARALAPASQRLVSPVDGTISQLGEVEEGTIYQAKGHRYSLAKLLGDANLAREFAAGKFATIYLAPNNYHRIHMPASGRLRCYSLIPGRLFSVNGATAACVPRLFARNERVVCVFDSERGPFAMVLVGALFVGSIETVWGGEITPGGGRMPRTWELTDGQVRPELQRGAEMGRFNMGSTVILLEASAQPAWHPGLHAGNTLRMGEALTASAQDSVAE